MSKQSKPKKPGKLPKNACRICFQTVTHKTGIQCEGACSNWVHFKCLNYSPGKIMDYKLGIVKVNCPCPDCAPANLEKEYRTDDPYSCPRTQCPANRPQTCEIKNCPKHVSSSNKINQTVNNEEAVKQCGKECQLHSKTHISRGMPGSTHNVGGHRSSPDRQFSGDMRRPPSSICGVQIGEMERMCNTVGKLTTQIQDLMNIMKQAVENTSSTPTRESSPIGTKGPATECTQPCLCPGNPLKKRT